MRFKTKEIENSCMKPGLLQKDLIECLILYAFFSPLAAEGTLIKN